MNRNVVILVLIALCFTATATAKSTSSERFRDAALAALVSVHNLETDADALAPCAAGKESLRDLRRMLSAADGALEMIARDDPGSLENRYPPSWPALG
jgi:hypothetical protein